MSECECGVFLSLIYFYLFEFCCLHPQIKMWHERCAAALAVALAVWRTAVACNYQAVSIFILCERLAIKNDVHGFS